MVTHSSILAWKIPWTEELGELQSMELQRAGQNWETPLSLSLCPISEKAMATHSSNLAWKIPWTEGLVWYSPRVTKSQTQLSDQVHTILTDCVCEGTKLYIKLTWSSQWHFEVGIVILQMGKSRLAFFTCKALLHENFWSCHWERCGVNLSFVMCSVVHSLPQP